MEAFHKNSRSMEIAALSDSKRHIAFVGSKRPAGKEKGPMIPSLDTVTDVSGLCKGGDWFGGFATFAVVVALSLVPLVALSGGSSSGPEIKSRAVRFEDIPKTTIKRVILTAKAVERLGIETGKVREEPVIETQMVGGRIVPRPKKRSTVNPSGGGFGGFGNLTPVRAPQPVEQPTDAPVDEQAWVAVALSQGEWERLWKDKPARVLPLITRVKTQKEVLAQPSEIPPYKDVKRTLLQLYYKLPERGHGLPLYQRVRVELPLKGSNERRKVVPYSAVYYDSKGSAWLYKNPQPLVFERQRIEVAKIAGDLAILSQGPPVDTEVVTVGSALLYGAEVIFKK
jgi:hypothetical protein